MARVGGRRRNKEEEKRAAATIEGSSEGGIITPANRRCSEEGPWKIFRGTPAFKERPYVVITTLLVAIFVVEVPGKVYVTYCLI